MEQQKIKTPPADLQVHTLQEAGETLTGITFARIKKYPSKNEINDGINNKKPTTKTFPIGYTQTKNLLFPLFIYYGLWGKN